MNLSSVFALITRAYPRNDLRNPPRNFRGSTEDAASISPHVVIRENNAIAPPEIILLRAGMEANRQSKQAGTIR